MDSTEHNPDLSAAFPELADPAKTIARIGQAFITGEQAYAAFTFIDGLRRAFADRLQLGKNSALFPVDEIGSLILMVGDEAVLNFHIVQESELDEDPFTDEGKGLQEMDYEALSGGGNGNGHSNGNGDGADDEGVYYQAGIMLLDNQVIPADTIFEREDLDCRTYSTFDDGPDGGRLYQARFIMELEDLHNPELIAAIRGAVDFLLAHPDDFEPYTEEHNADMEKIFGDASLFERVTDAADFDNVVDL